MVPSADARVVMSITNEMSGFPTDVTTIVGSLSLRVSDIIEAQVIRVKGHILKILYEKLKLSFGCRACGKACPDESIQFEQEYHNVTCGVVKKVEPKMYMRFKCTDGMGTLTLDACTRNIERLFQTNSRDFFTMTLPDRRRVVDRAQIRFRIGMAEFLISPVKSLFVNHNKIKWFLKEVVV